MSLFKKRIFIYLNYYFIHKFFSTKFIKIGYKGYVILLNINKSRSFIVPRDEVGIPILG
jgi:hypothetical protein